jgi:hypothetical protein
MEHLALMSYLSCSIKLFWEVIKGDPVKIFEDLHKGDLNLYRFNFALITVIPKEKDVRTMNKFRPISLLNCSYNFFLLKLL